MIALKSAVEPGTARYPSLEGRVVLVTGGGSGIGASLVEHFADQGAETLFLELSEAAAEKTATDIAERTGKAPKWRAVDLCDTTATKAAIESLAAEAGGPITGLVNNAGNDDRHPALEVTAELWDERFATNLRHQFFCAQAVLPGMIAAGGGAIVNLGSNSWMQGAPGLVAYTTAKSAVAGLTRSLAREFGDKNVRVNCIAPGWILTERQVKRAEAIYQGKFDEYLAKQCLKEFLFPPDIARLALWLVADDARMVTSQTFIVDGGVV
ncbi:SDR family NAD(P)-dependent oxidoreductase [Acuticoccus kandeliae]|uniref:SDR family NAD(P)-dependent oxidoreductase n=1 Tax=Acuticoccus kandeliae TaxID=2073160 RepID=UPI000D3EA0C6|nr:SDR family NAD(P)-dependent oxidoreductase [Acuticoccus kandeliae]